MPKRTSPFPSLTMLAVLVGCGAAPPAPVYPHEDDAFGPPERVEPEGIAEDPARPMTLTPGDVLTLRAVSAETTLYEGLMVDEAGLLHVPLAGDVEVGGLPLEQAEERVQQALRQFDTVVVANLYVSDAAGHQASVIGAVVEAGRVRVSPGMRLVDLLATAGGPIVEVDNAESVVLADLYGARLVRDGEALPVSLSLALQGDPRHNVRIRPGDTLYVPPNMGSRITVLGHVTDATVIAYREGLRLTEALGMAGGVNRDGDRGDVRIIRGDLRSPQVYTASLWDLKDGDGYDVVLAPGDIVFVTEDWMASVGEVLDRLSPLLSAGTAFGVTFAVVRN